MIQKHKEKLKLLKIELHLRFDLTKTILKTLAAESVESPPLPLESIHHIHGRHRLPPRVLGVGDGVTDNVLQKDLEDATSLLVDQTADTLHASSTSQTTNRRLGDTLDVVSENLPVTLGSSFPQTLASLSTTRHFSTTLNLKFSQGSFVLVLCINEESNGLYYIVVI